MKINHNMAAIQTLNSLTKANNAAADTMERLSSGLKINSAADNAAGLAISKKMDSQICSLAQAEDNVMDAISLIQTAEGAYEEVHSMLQRMRELTIQAGNDTYDTDDINAMKEEISQLLDEIESVQDRTEFNKMDLLNETKDSFVFQIGANEKQTMEIVGKDMNLTHVLGLLDTNKDFDGNTIAKVNQEGDLVTNIVMDTDAALRQIDAAISMASEIRSKLGAYQNRLEYTASSLGVTQENLTEALSRITDADMAEEMANYTQKNVLVQAATAMLAQANQRPQQVLELLN